MLLSAGALPGNEPLKPDLRATIAEIPAGSVFVVGETVKLPVTIYNDGGAPAAGSLRVDIYASGDSQLDRSTDILLATATLSPSLAASTSRTLNVSFLVPTGAQAGQWMLIADVDTLGRFDELREDNNQSPPRPATVSWEFGALSGRFKPTNLALRDDDGSVATFSLKGNGTGEVSLVNQQWTLNLTDTNASSTIAVMVRGGDGRIELGNITLGSIKSIIAPAVDLAGDLTATGTVSSITLGDVSPGHAVTVLGAVVPLTFVARGVANLRLNSSEPISNLKVVNWSRSEGGASSICAPSLKTLQVTGDARTGISGDLQADLVLTNPSGSLPSLGAVTVAGQLGPGTWHVVGSAGKLAVGRTSNGWAADFTGALAGITVNGDAAGSVAANSIGTITIAGDLNGGWFLAGAGLGSDAQLGGNGPAADAFGPGTVGTVKIGGRSLRGVIAAGLDPLDGSIGDNDAVVGAAASTVAGLTIGGTVSDDSLFAGGRLVSAVKISGVKIDPSRDSRFLVGAPGAVEAARVFVSAASGGTVELSDGSSASIPAGALNADSYVVLSRLAAMPANPPGGMVVAVGPSLSLSFVPVPSVGVAARMLAAGAVDDKIRCVLPLGAGASARAEGSVPMVNIIGPAGVGNYGATEGVVDVAGGTAHIDLPVDTVVNVSDVGKTRINFGLGNLNPSLLPDVVPPEQMVWNGRQFVNLASAGSLQTTPGTRTLVVVHGMLSTVDKAFGESIAKIMAEGHYDQVVGFNYDWTQHINDSGDQLSAFLERLRIAGITSVDIEAHSEGGPVSLSGAARNSQSDHPIEIDHMVLLGSPIMGTPAGWEGIAIGTMLMGTAAALGHASAAVSLAELLQRGFAQDLASGSSILSGIRDDFATSRPNTDVYVAAGNNPWDSRAGTGMAIFTSPVFDVLNEPHDSIVGVSSALANGWSLARLHRLGEFPVSHTQLESYLPLIQAIAAEIAPPAGFAVSRTDDLETSEDRDSDGFMVALTTKPSGNVTIKLSSSDTSEGMVSPTSLTFTPSNWNTARPVTVTGVDDSDADGDIRYSIRCAPVVSTDSRYSGMTLSDVIATNFDNEVAPGIEMTSWGATRLSGAERASGNFRFTVSGTASGPVGVWLCVNPPAGFDASGYQFTSEWTEGTFTDEGYIWSKDGNYAAIRRSGDPTTTTFTCSYTAYVDTYDHPTGSVPGINAMLAAVPPDGHAILDSTGWIQLWV